MNTKAKGSRRERQTRDLLEQRGFHVTKAGGSLGIWDLVAYEPGMTLFVQVKSNRPPGRDEMGRMEAFEVGSCARKELWIWHDGDLVPEIRRVK